MTRSHRPISTRLLLGALVLSVLPVDVAPRFCAPSSWVTTAAAERRRRRTPRARRRMGLQLLRLGIQKMASGDYAGAIDALNNSFKLVPAMPTLMALAQCYELGQQLDTALKVYKRLLPKTNDKKKHEQLVAKIAELEQRLRSGAKPPPPPHKPDGNDAAGGGRAGDGRTGSTAKPDGRNGSTGGSDRPTGHGAGDQGGDATEDIGSDTAQDSGGDTTENIGGDTTENIGGDTTENIGGTTDSGGDGSGTDELSTTPGSAIEVTGLLSGWYRSSLDIDLGHDRADSSTDLVEDSLEFRNRLLMRLDVRYGATYQGFVAVVLDHVIKEQPPSGDDTFLLFNGRSARGEFNAAVVEAYVGISLWKLDFRVGMLRVAWGKSDYTSPNDVINPRDLRNPLREELELLRLPVLALETTMVLKPFTIELILQPIFRGDQMALYSTDFGVFSPVLPAPIRGLGRFIQGLHDPGLTSRVESLLIQSELPADDLSAFSPGLRVSAEIHGVDLSLYYQYGWDTTPLLELNPRVLGQLATVDWKSVTLGQLAPLLQLVDAGMQLYRSHYIRRHHVGGDIGTTIGSFSVRAEAALDSQRIFYDTNLAGQSHPAIALNVGAEYQHSLYQMVLLEASYLHAIAGPAEYLFYDQDSVGVGGMVRWGIMDGDLTGEVRAFFSMSPWSYIVRPQISYKISRRWQVSVGALVLGGDVRGVGGYFDRNDLMFFEGLCNI